LFQGGFHCRDKEMMVDMKSEKERSLNFTMQSLARQIFVDISENVTADVSQVFVTLKPL
jgi:hypothetical protein